ncbi:hypothetical protein [Vibrio sp. 10N.222.55.C7]|uniref:hypothetical protein n=1 Tax=Vibrio sp. 10N.222.55.C7 TaxID=3229650 RepID=UPI0035505417
MDNIKHKMIQISDDFSLVAEHLKEQLSKSALQGDVEHFNKNKIKYDYLTELSNIMANLKVEAQEGYEHDQ